MRIGFGFDVHQLINEGDFWLGGIKIPSAKGILAHSDGDVLIHAISDALLGALSLGDIGMHFPDTDKSLKGIDSKIILSKIVEMITDKGYKISNLDCSVVAEMPKIKPFYDDMKRCIASICKIGVDDVSIKATTNEKLGFIGREEGITAYAVVLLVKI